MQPLGGLGSARILACFFVVLLVALTGCDRRSPKRVLLITVDTLRGDHLSGYGYERPTSPHLDRLLAEEGILFQRVYASSPWTLPSVTSILTSLHPPQHGLIHDDVRLSRQIPTLASLFRQQGWKTVGFIGHIYVGSQFGLDQGFEEFHEFYPKADSDREYIDAGAMMTGVEAWLTHRGDQPFFLYLHLFDPHFDYAPPAPFDRRFSDPSYGGEADGSWRFVSPYAAPDRLLSADDLAQVIALYDGEIRWTDEQLGRLFAFLKARNLWDDTAIVITSDHGEEFQEHRSMHHTRTLYEEVLRVPLILKLPGGRGARRSVIEESVRGLDVAPTLLELAGIEVPSTFEGESLLPLLKRPGRDRPALAHTVRYGSDKAALIVGPHKLIHHFGHGAYERFDLASDPHEQSPLPAGEDGMREELASELERLENFAVQPEDAELTEEQRQRLEALGYMR